MTRTRTSGTASGSDDRGAVSRSPNPTRLSNLRPRSNSESGPSSSEAAASTSRTSLPYAISSSMGASFGPWISTLITWPPLTF